MTLPRVTTAVALVLAYCAAFFYSPLSPAAAVGDLFMLAAVIAQVMALGMGGAALLRFGSQPAPSQSIYRWRHGARVLFGIGLLLLLALLKLHIHLQFALFCVGIVLVRMGLSSNGHSITHVYNVSVYEWILLVIILLAFLVRIVNLEDSVHIFVDEMHFTDGVTNLWDNPNQPLLSHMSGIAGFTWFYAYLQTYTVAIFGATFTGLRIVSVLFGTLTIPVVYGLAREWFDRPTGLLAALLLALFPPHIHFSRLALNNIADPFFGMLALLLLARAMRTGRSDQFVLAGVALGLTQYWYEGGKLIFPVVVGLGVINRFRDLSRLYRLIGAMLIVVMPLAISLERQGMPYLPRLKAERDTSLLLDSDYLRDQFNPAFYHLIQHPDGAEYYGGATGLILPYLVPFFILGVVHCLWRRQLMLVSIVALTVIGNSLIDDPDWSARFVVALPALAIIMAVGLRSTWVLLMPNRRMLPAMVVFLSVQLAYYFGPHLTLFNQQARPFKDHQDMAWRIRDFPEGTHVLLFTDELVFLKHFESLERYWQRDLNLQVLHPFEMYIRRPNRLPRGGDVAIFMQPENRDLIHFLNSGVDLGTPIFSPYATVPRNKQYVLFYLEGNGEG